MDADDTSACTGGEMDEDQSQDSLSSSSCVVGDVPDVLGISTRVNRGEDSECSVSSATSDLREESSVDDSVAEPVLFRGKQVAVNMNYVSGSYGQGKVFRTPNELHSIPYPMLYRCRGQQLRMLNRLEYYALVDVKQREKKRQQLEDQLGRPTSKEFPFGEGLEEQIGGEGIGRYFQYMRSKQCTPQFFSSPPRHPGRRPVDDEDDALKRWQDRADKFACNYLIMFRPELELYEKGQTCTYEYDWDAFLGFIKELKSSDRAIDHSRLEMIDRMVHSWGVDDEKKSVLQTFRERDRDMWSQEEKTLAKAEFAKWKKMFGGDDEDDEMMAVNGDTSDLTVQQRNNVIKTLTHTGALERELSKSRGVEKAEGDVFPTETSEYDEEFARTLSKLQKECITNADERGVRARGAKLPVTIQRKVDRYLKDQKLSADKLPVINAMIEHYKAIYEGRDMDKSYDPPLLLVCGGPGNGKSKLVETFDGITSLMKTGTQINTAYLGVAAVNIGGTSLCTLLNIPTDRDPRMNATKHTIVPWSKEKKQQFRKQYDVDNISCFVVDEISTVQPYLLAYLSARLMELYPESGKDFGGKAVVLLGDFHQLPPVGGDNIAKSGMTQEGKSVVTKKKKKSKTIQRWDPTQHSVNMKKEGLRLFQKAGFFDLTTQHRSKDQLHTDFIESVRTSGQIPLSGLKRYKLLQESDMKSDKDFRFATIVVTGNQDRHRLNHSQSRDWAVYHQTNNVRWLRKIDFESWKGLTTSREGVMDSIKQNECFYETFVPGAQGFLNANINTSIGLANGTEIKFDSISFANKDDEKEYTKHKASMTAGETITLEKPPVAINVEIFADFPGDSEAQKRKNKIKREGWKFKTLADDGRVVIPIAHSRYRSYMEYERNNIREKITNSKGIHINTHCSRVLLKDYFPIEPGFSMTIHKAQVSGLFCSDN